MLRAQEDNFQENGYIIGLDASLACFGLYCMPVHGSEWYGLSLQSTTRDGSDTRRVLDIAHGVIDTLNALPYPIRIACFEDYGPINRTSGKITQRAEICGIIKYHLLHVIKVPVLAVSPKSLKGYATGNGNSGKELMLNAANKLGYYPNTHDEADAFFAARIARDVLECNNPKVSITRTNP